MSNKHQKIFAHIFERPDRKDVEWSDFVNLLDYLGAIIRHQSGSAVGVKLNGEYAVFHKPHPESTIYLAELKRIRIFLINAGIKEVE